MNDVAKRFSTLDIIDKLVILGEQMMGCKLHDYQKRFLIAILKSFIDNDGDTITALISRQAGKTQVNATAICIILVVIPAMAKYFPKLKKFERGVKVGAYSPVTDQVETLLYRVKFALRSYEGQQVLSDKDINSELVPGEGDINLTNGSYFIAKGAGGNSKLESKTHDIVFIDEAQSMDDSKLLYSIRPMGASTNATFVYTGTCYTHKSEFYYECERGKKKSLNRTFFMFDYNYCSKVNSYYKKFVDKEIAKFGAHSDYIRMMFKLEWIFERGTFISGDAFEQVCIKSLGFTRNTSGSLKNSSKIKIVAGLDLGKKHDSTVLTIGEIDFRQRNEHEFAMKTVYNWLTLLGDSYEEQYDQICDFLRNYPDIQEIVVDSTGLGEVVCDSLDKRFMQLGWYIDIHRVNFVRDKAELYNNLNTQIFQRMLRFPGHANARKTKRWETYVHETTSLVKDYDTKGRLSVGAPNDKYSHDDHPTSLALFAWAERFTYPEIEVSDSNIYKTGRHNA